MARQYMPKNMNKEAGLEPERLHPIVETALVISFLALLAMSVFSFIDFVFDFNVWEWYLSKLPW